MKCKATNVPPAGEVDIPALKEKYRQQREIRVQPAGPGEVPWPPAPADGRCMCLFEADDAESVKAVNDEAGIPYTRVVPAHDLTPS